MIHHEGSLGLTSEKLDAVTHAESTAETTRAGGALAQRVLLEQHWKVLLEHFSGLRLRYTDCRASVADSIAAPPAAIAATAEHIHDEAGLTRRIVAAEGEISAGAGGARKHPIRNCPAEGAEHGFHDALRRFRGAAGNRTRVFRI